MNNEEARFILQACRPNGADAADPVFRAALEQARLDPELGRWFEKQQAFDRAMTGKLRAIQPPADLRESILAGARVGRAEQSPWWRRHQWLAAAAVLVLTFLVGVGGFMGTRANAADDFPVFATDYVSAGFFLKEHGADVQKLRAWLGQQNAPLPTEIPAGFASLKSLGCKTLDYRGKDVSLICFGEGREYHLFVLRRSDFPEMKLAGSGPQFFVRNGHSSAAWSDEVNHYVVVTDDSLKALMECINCRSS